MVRLTLDARITDSIRDSLPKAQPRFDYYLGERRLAVHINEASVEQLGEFQLAGEIALFQCLARYTLSRRTPETPLNYHGTLQTHILCPRIYHLLVSPWLRLTSTNACSMDAMHLFVGVLSTILGFPSTYVWFLDAFGPLLDSASEVYDAYQSTSTSRTAEKRPSDGGESHSKRTKYTHRERVNFHYTKVKGILSDLSSAQSSPSTISSSLMNASSPRENLQDVYEELEVAAILRLQSPTLDGVNFPSFFIAQPHTIPPSSLGLSLSKPASATVPPSSSPCNFPYQSYAMPLRENLEDIVDENEVESILRSQSPTPDSPTSPALSSGQVPTTSPRSPGSSHTSMRRTPSDSQQASSNSSAIVVRERSRNFVAGAMTFARRKVASLKRIARKKTFSSISQDLQDGFVSVLNTGAEDVTCSVTKQTIPPTPKPSSQLAPPLLLSPPFRRGRAPSPPSPLPDMLFKASRATNVPVSYETYASHKYPSTATFSTHEIPNPMKTWYPNRQSTPAHKRRQTSSAQNSVPSALDHSNSSSAGGSRLNASE
ncbi:hypothetical protein B0H15DRAFT_147151 [Mycena belliarum]|uniref:Uncharacterized protein n=1 Tax=Mycena belliarum TaxID=1033014 RepID=A0AAD6U8E2_9AGAR|nr:hypothetical protein B0H15DRAFT_147151 [Mycena belliae]